MLNVWPVRCAAPSAVSLPQYYMSGLQAQLLPTLFSSAMLERTVLDWQAYAASSPELQVVLQRTMLLRDNMIEVWLFV